MGGKIDLIPFKVQNVFLDSNIYPENQPSSKIPATAVGETKISRIKQVDIKIRRNFCGVAQS